MNSNEQLAFPKEKAHFLLSVSSGQLEVMTTYPSSAADKVAIICHPHPLYEGSMRNKVVTTLARAFEQLGLATVRFNFRGVGKSSGSYGETIGESDDLRAVIAWVQQVLPKHDIWLAGFSFGAYISANLASQLPKVIKQLVSIAPPVNHYDFVHFKQVQCPWLVVQGDQDEVVPFAQVAEWAQKPPVPVKFIVMPGVTHFFHGHLIALREILIDNLLP